MGRLDVYLSDDRMHRLFARNCFATASIERGDKADGLGACASLTHTFLQLPTQPPPTCYPGASYQIREAGELRLAEVHVQDGETLESALRRFKRKVQTEDIIKEIKRHSFYLKPGEKKRTKEALARKRNRKKRTRDTE